MIEFILKILAGGGAILLALRWLGIFDDSTEGSSKIPPGKVYIKEGKVYPGSSNDEGAENFNYAKDHDRNTGSY